MKVVQVVKKTTNLTVARAGIRGLTGPQGPQGDGGWSPILAVVSDGARRVYQVIDWTGGEGTKPATGSYIGPTGLVADIASAVDVRGDPGIGVPDPSQQPDGKVLATLTGAAVWSDPASGFAPADLESMSVTWDDGLTRTGIGLDVTDTSSANGSQLHRVSVNGQRIFGIVKSVNGNEWQTIFDGPNHSVNMFFSGSGPRASLQESGFFMRASGAMVWSRSDTNINSTRDLFLHRDAAGVLAQRVGTSPQAQRLYNTYTDSANFERAYWRWSAGVLQFGTESAGTGASTLHVDLTASGDGELRAQSPFAPPAFTVLTVPDATLHAGAYIHVSDEVGGPVLAFSDGTNWRRVTDRAIIS